jgi:hypothetical protein
VSLRLKLSVTRLDGEQFAAGWVGAHPSLDIHAVADLDALTDAEEVDEAWAILAKGANVSLVTLALTTHLRKPDRILAGLLLKDVLDHAVDLLLSEDSSRHIDGVGSAQDAVPRDVRFVREVYLTLQRSLTSWPSTPGHIGSQRVQSILRRFAGLETI